ncbi:aminopeptidase N-like [Ceratina calcarata]|uniref:Aminopeptidase n=1 Tax=Ceratina calcarata TaxID=156304 RepID=A0AAJ7J4R6_9HYME|nr:aminopeptidase N-like [Ceratina calcarata]
MRTFVTCLLVLGICQASFQLENTVGEADLRYRLPSDIVMPIAYKLHLKPNLGRITFDGEVDITLIALNTSDTLTLNSKYLFIYDVKFVDLNTTNTLWNKYLVDKSHEILNITIKPRFEKDHHYSLQIQFVGVSRDNTTGIYKRLVQTDGVTEHVATTHFKPTKARQTFPCWDEPVYKAKFNITLTHNKTLQAISNMDVLKKEEKDGMMTTSFKETPLMSTYLVAFVLSNYQFKEDRVGNFTYRVWTKASTINQTDYALKMGRKLLEQLNSYTNISYQTYMPDKIDQVAVKSFFLNTAMENWGLVIYSESNLLYDEILNATRTKMDVLTNIAHEFTHQWFGNLVSPKWWKYVWLNEGFAKYFQYFIAHKVEPELRLDDMFVVERMQGYAMVTDAVPMIRPINKDVITPQELLKTFDAIAHEKAASIIRMMSHAMTEEVFHKGLKLYLKSHALGNADSNDLFGSLQKALDESGIKWKQSVQVIMHNWVEYPGYPTLTVKRVDEGYQLTQERFLIVFSKFHKYRTKWWIPITYVQESDPNFTNTTPVDWFSPDDESYTVPSKEKTGWFVFNTQQAGYYRVNYEIENWKLLIKELNKGNNTKIHPVNRAQMIDDAFNLARTESLNYTLALNVTLYLTHETDYIPWQPAFRHLGFLQNLLRTSNKYYTFKRYVAYLMKALTKNVGYEPKANDSDLVKMLRVDAMRWACEVGIEDCTSYAEKTYQEWLKNPQMKLDVNLKTEILCAGVRNANESAWTDTLGYITASTTDEDDRKNQLVALACSNSSHILTKYLNLTLDSNYPIDFKTVAKNVVSRYPAGSQLVFNFLLKEYERIEKLPNSKIVIAELAEAISETITSGQQHFNLNAFLLDRRVEELPEFAMAKAIKNVIWIQNYKSTVDEWLDANSNLFDSPDNGGDSASSSYLRFDRTKGEF